MQAGCARPSTRSSRLASKPAAGSLNRLPLLIELDPDALRKRSLEGGENVSAETSSGSGTQMAGAAPGLRCYTVGPFKTGATIRGRAKTWLEGKGATVSTRFGADGITIVDPNRAEEGASAVFEKVYEKAI